MREVVHAVEVWHGDLQLLLAGNVHDGGIQQPFSPRAHRAEMVFSDYQNTVVFAKDARGSIVVGEGKGKDLAARLHARLHGSLQKDAHRAVGITFLRHQFHGGIRVQESFRLQNDRRRSDDGGNGRRRQKSVVYQKRNGQKGGIDGDHFTQNALLGR